MKKLQVAIAVSLTAAMSASASVTVYSDTDFSSMVSYNGTYVSGSPGYEHLAYSGVDDAVVGVVGPLGALDNLSMSFQYSNPIGTGNAPFAAFGVSVDGNWGAGSAYEYEIISMDGNQLNGTSRVHVWDFNLNGGQGGDVAGLGQSDNVTLDDVLGIDNSYNGVAFGDLEVMRAYAYIGDTGGSSSGSVDINSITITSVPESTTMIAGALLLLPFGASTLRILRKSRMA